MQHTVLLKCAAKNAFVFALTAAARERFSENITRGRVPLLFLHIQAVRQGVLNGLRADEIRFLVEQLCGAH
jgi:hypothetical protein